MMTSALWGRINLALIAGLVALMGTGGIPPKYGMYVVAVLAALQSLTHKVTQSTSDNQAAEVAVTSNQNLTAVAAQKEHP